MSKDELRDIIITRLKQELIKQVTYHIKLLDISKRAVYNKALTYLYKTFPIILCLLIHDIMSIKVVIILLYLLLTIFYLFRQGIRDIDELYFYRMNVKLEAVRDFILYKNTKYNSDIFFINISKYIKETTTEDDIESIVMKLVNTDYNISKLNKLDLLRFTYDESITSKSECTSCILTLLKDIDSLSLRSIREREGR